MNFIKQKSKGFIAIVSLLIISTIAMIFAMSILKEGVNNASLSLHSLYYEDAHINALTCLEDVLLRIKKEEQFERELDYTISDENTCSASIEWFSPQQVAPNILERLANVSITGISNGFTRSFIYGLRISRYDVNYSDGTMDYMNTIDTISINEITS